MMAASGCSERTPRTISAPTAKAADELQLGFVERLGFVQKLHGNGNLPEFVQVGGRRHQPDPHVAQVQHQRHLLAHVGDAFAVAVHVQVTRGDGACQRLHHFGAGILDLALQPVHRAAHLGSHGMAVVLHAQQRGLELVPRAGGVERPRKHREAVVRGPPAPVKGAPGSVTTKWQPAPFSSRNLRTYPMCSYDRLAPQVADHHVGHQALFQRLPGFLPIGDHGGRVMTGLHDQSSSAISSRRSLRMRMRPEKIMRGLCGRG
jgi:hypothetical protein